ncbi:MAG: LSM domain-containing protein, partial [Candidatus Bathyarchaeia archaeon]
MSAMERRFITEVTSLVDKVVSVVTVDGKTYTGTLTGIDPNSLSLCLSDARDDKGRAIPKIVISGSRVAEIFSIEKPFDLKGLAE